MDDTIYFIIGLNKTGTSSIRNCLYSSLNLEKDYYPPILAYDKVFHNRMLNRQVGSLYKVTDFLIKHEKKIFSDRPWNMGMHIELKNKYPNAKFILTIRDEEDWWNSIIKWLDINAVWGKNIKDLNIKQKNLYNKILEYNSHFKSKYLDKEKYLSFYRSYNKEVVEYFDKIQNFYLINISQTNNWDVIQNIVGLDEIIIKNNIQNYYQKFNEISINLSAPLKDTPILCANKNRNVIYQ
jgi:hypothetical protein